MLSASIVSDNAQNAVCNKLHSEKKMMINTKKNNTHYLVRNCFCHLCGIGAARVAVNRQIRLMVVKAGISMDEYFLC